MATTIAVTGSTGAVGGAVARLLADQGHTQRLLVRSLSRAPDLPRATAVENTYDDPGTVDALTGVETLFMVSGAESADRLDQHRSFIAGAAAAGVRRIVYTTFFGAAPDATFTLARDHFVTEELIKDSGMAYTLLRDDLYLDFLPALAGQDGVIRGPAGAGKVAAVALEDIARSSSQFSTTCPVIRTALMTSPAPRRCRWSRSPQS